MEWIVDAEEMKRCDFNTTNHFGIPSLVLMERAALKTVELIRRRRLDAGPILIVCGVGNNGGDGLAVARMLYNGGCPADILLVGDKDKFTAEAKVQYEICMRYGLSFINQIQRPYALIVDALFGVGLSRNLEGAYAAAIEQINGMEGVKLAVDIPSGISADTGCVMGIALKADLTVTFAYRKLGHVFYPWSAYAGELVIADIGVNEHSWLSQRPKVASYESEDLKKLLLRAPDGNKGVFGKALVAGGSPGMAGAAYFAAKAAYRSGCGLVKIYTAEENRIVLQTKLPEAILCTYADNRPDISGLLAEVERADVIIVGPGLGTDHRARLIVESIVKNARVPVVADADALNVLAKNLQPLSEAKAEMVITPHMGEMSRLTGKEIPYLKEHIISAAEEFARAYRATCVLKDARTVTALSSGKIFLNQTGNDGMATGGSGDVLAGMIGGMIAQGVPPELAAPAGVYWHGLSGDAAADRCGRHAMTACDILENIRDDVKAEHARETESKGKWDAEWKISPENTKGFTRR